MMRQEDNIMEIKKKEQNEPAYPDKHALKIGLAVVAAAGVLIGGAAAAGCGENDLQYDGGLQYYGDPDYVGGLELPPDVADDDTVTSCTDGSCTSDSDAEDACSPSDCD